MKIFEYPITWDFTNHIKGGSKTPGIDFGMPIGTPVQPLVSGTVTFTGEDPGSINPRDGSNAKYIVIDEGNNTKRFYVHLSKITAVKGQKLDKDLDIVGYSGDTGNTSGPHLHVGKRVENAYVDFINEINSYKNEMQEKINQLLKQIKYLQGEYDLASSQNREGHNFIDVQAKQIANLSDENAKLASLFQEANAKIEEQKKEIESIQTDSVNTQEGLTEFEKSSLYSICSKLYLLLNKK